MTDNNNTLLIEFLTEELPPFRLKENIGLPFANGVYQELQKFLHPGSTLTPFISPRRFGCLISGITFAAPDKLVRRKGPAITTGLKGGLASSALLGFAKSCNTTWEELKQADDGYFYFVSLVKGASLSTVLPEAIQHALKKIEIAKAMSWGNNDFQFVRPVHNLVVLFNDEVIACNAFNLTSSNQTLGHRFMANYPLTVNTASSYLTILEQDGKVIADFDYRCQLINGQLQKMAAKLGLKISHIDGLLEEVTALVEWPVALAGEFEHKFLQVPQECLILSMAKNQKYFALVDANGKLSNKFLFIVNLESTDPQVVISGNQKVLSARLADAEFFFEVDKKTALKDFVAKMASVVYHNKLGTQLERINRLQEIATALAPGLGVESLLAKHTAYLLKVDLTTEMVGEFPELQGVMGKYYARLSHETEEVANAIEKHYYPRFSGDSLPDGNLAVLMSLVDKLETLVGIWGIGLIPTGEKDPYALRRGALGVVRIMLANKLCLKTILEKTFAVFAGKGLNPNTVAELYEFILQRLTNYLTSVENYPAKVVNAVITNANFDYVQAGDKYLNHLPELLAVLVNFANNKSNQALFQANKRIENILKKNASEIAPAMVINKELLHDGAEQQLYRIFSEELDNGTALTALVNNANWQDYFVALSQFNQPLDNFFNEVMVMTDDKELRCNRFSLLKTLHQHFNLICQLSELA